MTPKFALQTHFASLLRRPRLRQAARTLVRALRVPIGVRQRLPVDGAFAFSLLDRPFTYHSALHDGVGRELFWAPDNDYERETLSVLVRILKSSSSTPTVFDVGANTGVYTMAALAVAPAACVHAFEPVAHIARALATNVASNGLLGQVSINECAVSDEIGTVALHIPDETWGNATMSAAGFRGLRGHVEHVQAVTLDTYAVERGIDRIDLLKIDVEGHEDAVLRGARCILAEHRPAVLCECLPELDAVAVNRLLTELGYTTYHLQAGGPALVPHMRADATGQFKNYLLMPDERSEQLLLR